MIDNEIQKLISKIEAKIEKLEEQKEYVNEKKFLKILDKIYQLNKDLDELRTVLRYLQIDKTKYKITVSVR